MATPGLAGAATGQGEGQQVAASQPSAEDAFLRALEERVVLADGAMGTLLYARGVPADASFDLLNLNDRERVLRVHLDYLAAGAEVIETNTYGANRLQLRGWGADEQVWSVNVWGAKIARQAREIAGQPVWVAGAVGPLGKPLAPIGAISPQEAEGLFREQMEALLAGGVDLFIVETMADVEEALAAVRAARSICRLPVVVQFSFSPDGLTPQGQSPEAVMRRLQEVEPGLQPDVIGVNCGAGPASLLEALRRMQAVASQPRRWSALPNAGLPARVGHRLLYGANAAYMATMVSAFVAAGVRLLGGCCGTTPEHIAAMRQALRGEAAGAGQAGAGLAGGPAGRVGTAAPLAMPASSPAAEAAGDTVGTGVQGSGAHGSGGPAAGLALGPGRVPVPRLEVTRPAPAVRVVGGGDVAEAEVPAGLPRPLLREKLARRQFVISVELDPPKGAVARRYLQAAEALKEAGVDCINVADSPMARVRMGAIAGAHLIQLQAGVETIIHFTTRDRNLMGIQSDLLGAHALGIRNVLALTGDPPSLGNTRATPVYDVDSVGLIHILQALNQGQDVGGNPIGGQTDFLIGCALSPNADDLETELARFRRKLEAGAHFVMTQPLYEKEPLERVLDRLGGCPVPILLGVMPLHSHKHAEYLHNEVPGITIPERVREELRLAGEDGLRVGLEQARQLVAEMRPLIAGIYVVLSFGKHEPICKLVQEIRAMVQAA